MTVIALNGVSKVFRRTPVLDELSLRLEAGDRVALIGSNGAGKTTLIRCLLGQYEHRGTISVDGHDPRRHRRAVLSRIGFVPQTAPPLKMPVGELVHFCSGLSGIERSRVEILGTRLDLDFNELARRPFVKLSGGQKQKILIALALARDPDLVIMDEPTANLDPQARKIFYDLLAARGDKPMLISSHRLEEVAAMVNRVVELDRGRVVLDDAVEDNGDPASRLECRITLLRPNQAFAHSIADWGFSAEADQRRWHGQVAGADRLRFFSVLSRYAGLVEELRMDRRNGPEGTPS